MSRAIALPMTASMSNIVFDMWMNIHGLRRMLVAYLGPSKMCGLLRMLDDVLPPYTNKYIYYACSDFVREVGVLSNKTSRSERPVSFCENHVPVGKAHVNGKETALLLGASEFFAAALLESYNKSAARRPSQTVLLKRSHVRRQCEPSIEIWCQTPMVDYSFVRRQQ